MSNNQNSKTEKNLLESFLADAKAFTKYMIYSDKAQREGYYQISKLFERIAKNQKEHAEIWLEFLNSLGTTKENLQDALKGEEFQKEKMYPHFSKIANDEGYDKISKKFKEIGKIKNNHYQEFLKYYKKIEEDTLYKRDYKTQWLCLNCAYIHKDQSSPDICPICRYEKSYFIENIN